jgi:hypothetical protein
VLRNRKYSNPVNIDPMDVACVYAQGNLYVISQIAERDSWRVDKNVPVSRVYCAEGTHLNIVYEYIDVIAWAVIMIAVADKKLIRSGRFVGI